MSSQKGEDLEDRAAGWVLAPIFLTWAYYLLPPTLQQLRIVQFLPQLVAYVALGWWCSRNVHPCERLGLSLSGMWVGLQWGTVTGLLLGAFNTMVILWVVPGLGGDIMFLRETPHAQVPTWLMVPWGIAVIALGVELNFRGFQLGRLLALCARWFRDAPKPSLMAGKILVVVSSALVFAFDPFMVTTFRHLHWIAVWDGMIWGALFLRTGNLVLVVMAHAVEVVILYSCVKMALT